MNNDVFADMFARVGRVLVVEDDLLLLRTCTNFIKVLMPSATVDSVDNGEDAVDRTEQNEYDLILTDMGLPLLSGAEVYRSVEASCLKNNRGMPCFIFCSGVKRVLKEVEQVSNKPGNAAIEKPYSLDLLKRNIIDVLDKKMQGCTTLP